MNAVYILTQKSMQQSCINSPKYSPCVVVQMILKRMETQKQDYEQLIGAASGFLLGVIQYEQ